MMNEFTYVAVRIFVMVIGALISAYLIPYLKQLSKKEQYKNVADTVMTAVQAAEQTITESGKGKEKKAEVVAYVSKWLTDNGIMISNEQLDSLIEASVWSMKNPSALVGDAK